MPQIVREDVGQLEARLTISLTNEDYEPKFNAELNKYRKEVSMKGFRKGKTPKALIRKMYGRAILSDTINELFQNAINDYLTKEKLEILGQPLPVEDQEPFDLDLTGKAAYTFKVELGLAPQFEVKGLEKENKFERYAVEIPEERIEEELGQARQRTGERSSVDDAVQEKDLIAFNAEELDGEELKENGWASTFNILVDLISNEELKSKVLGSNKGDKVRFNVFDLEKDRDRDYVRKYFLNVGEDDEEVEIGDHFEATIADITRVMPSELNQEFFDKYFGEGKVNSEEEARKLIEGDLQKFYDRQSESLLQKDFQERLIEENVLDLPEAFLKRWLQMTNENIDLEQIEKEFDDFAKGLRWSLVRGKLVKQFDIQVEEEEIVEGFKDRIRGYFGGYGDELIILNTANRMMQDQQQVDQLYQELMTGKVFEGIRNVAQVEDKKISIADFDQVIEAARKEAEAARNPVAPAEEEEVVEDEASTEETEEMAKEDSTT
ncbi:MAG: trigger factor [Bacteroidota bacterium]